MNLPIPAWLHAALVHQAQRRGIAHRTAVCQALEAWTAASAPPARTDLQQVIRWLNATIHGSDSPAAAALAVFLRADLERARPAKRRRKR